LFSFECVCNSSVSKTRDQKSKRAGARPTGIFAFQGPPSQAQTHLTSKEKRKKKKEKREKRKKRSQTPFPSFVVLGSSLGTVIVLFDSSVPFCLSALPIWSADEPIILQPQVEYREEKNQEKTQDEDSAFSSALRGYVFPSPHFCTPTASIKQGCFHRLGWV
jgi:hypothetical protein